MERGETRKAIRLLRGASKDYDDLKILDNQLGSFTHLPPSQPDDPLRLRGLFFESVATLLELKEAREKAARPGSSALDLEQKLIIERRVEALLTGNLSGPKRLGQENRLLNQVLSQKDKTWPINSQ